MRQLIITAAMALCLTTATAVRAQEEPSEAKTNSPQVEAQQEKQTSATPSAPEKEPEPTKEEVLAKKEGDIVLGEMDAPVTVTEYFSLSCPHCAAFEKNGAPLLLENFVSKGKVKYVMRHFPHNGPAFKAGLLLECVPEKRVPQFIKVLMKMQDDWAFTVSFEENLKKIATVGDVPAEDFDTCMADKDKQDAIFKRIDDARKTIGIKQIPTFFVNGERIKGNSYEALEPQVRKALKEAEAEDASEPAVEPAAE